LLNFFPNVSLYSVSDFVDNCMTDPLLTNCLPLSIIGLIFDEYSSFLQSDITYCNLFYILHTHKKKYVYKLVASYCTLLKLPFQLLEQRLEHLRCIRQRHCWESTEPFPKTLYPNFPLTVWRERHRLIKVICTEKYLLIFKLLLKQNKPYVTKKWTFK